jgi:hypothetical protein
MEDQTQIYDYDDIKKPNSSLVIKSGFFRDTAKINNCSSPSDAISLFSEPWFQAKFREIFVFRFMITGLLPVIAKPNVAQFKSFERVLIAFESAQDNCQKIFLLKSQNTFVMLDLTEGVSTELGDFIRDFLKNALKADAHGEKIEKLFKIFFLNLKVSTIF